MTTAMPDVAALTHHYEALRAWATAEAGPVARPPGLALALRLGLPGWLAARALWEPAAGTTAPPPSNGAAARGDRLAALLASMVERCQQEQEP
jgi:hypothetical protein